MKSILRLVLTTAAGLFITSWIVPGFSISKDPLTFATVTLILVGANWLIKPILKILFMPLNIATFGLFSIAINAIILFGISYFFGGITVTDWTLARFTYDGFVIPEIQFGIIATYLASGFVIGVITTTVNWLTNH